MQYRYVIDDYQLIKAILSLFTISKCLPSSTDLLFCNEYTEANEIETFVLRAMLCQRQISRQKLFVVANFQKLDFRTQNQCYEFLKQQEGVYAKSGFYLYVVSAC